ncbi:B3 domain-containing protein At2g33720-like [Juglans microcarpa x Juglans regia]|uniref:B3 domain-containing protein At2g33720-like n=1 Tax=Juglans microcarpa x Juglans regia TaxID=2249226 RepID=UPI001B7D9329|nr:B3 domain-containing protein At2g33720-like [Juglans microcarpa x Juglans regia]
MNSEHVLDYMKDAVCTESTVSCGFQSKAASMESKLSCWIDPEAVSTELTLSCGPVQIESKKCKAPEARNSLHHVSFARIHELLFTDPRKTSETVMINSEVNPKEDSPVSDNSEVTVTSIHNAVTARTGSVRLDKDLHEERSTPTAMEVNPWKIKKTLTESDLGNLSRLLLKTTWVRDHVLPFLDSDIIRSEVESDQGMRVKVWDQDSQSAHELVLKKWKTCKSYVLINGWHKDFVNRRNLKKGDVIGLYWDPFDSIFHFSVLQSWADLVADHHHQPNL